MAKILLVEDNEMNRDMLSRRLKRKGHEVILGEDGQGGVDMAASEQPDIILMDMSLPVIDGWEATRRLKAGSDRTGPASRQDRALAQFAVWLIRPLWPSGG
jgi:CheY-like chemotaxis protein